MRKFILLLIILSLTSCIEVKTSYLNSGEFYYIKKVDSVYKINSPKKVYRYYVGPKFGDTIYFVIIGGPEDYQLGDKIEIVKKN